MSDEVMKILKLLENGKVSAEEAERLISAVSGRKQGSGFYVPPPQKPPKMPKEFVRKIEIIPDQIGQAISAAFGSMGSNTGRKSFPDAKEFEIKVVSGKLGLIKGEDEIVIDGAAWPMKTAVENDRLIINSINTNANLEIPKGIVGIASVVSADLHAKGIESDIQLEQVSGDIEIENCSGNWKVVTVSGDVDIDGFSGKLHCRSRNGDIELDISGPGEYTVNTITGDIKVSYPDGFAIEMNANSREGEVEIPESKTSTEVGEKGKIKLLLKSVNGDIKIKE